MRAGVPVRHIEENRNVPMYLTNIPCKSAGVFSGNIVVSMRPIPSRLVPLAVTTTAQMPRVHGAPIHIGCPASPTSISPISATPSPSTPASSRSSGRAA